MSRRSHISALVPLVSRRLTRFESTLASGYAAERNSQTAVEGIHQSPSQHFSKTAADATAEAVERAIERAVKRAAENRVLLDGPDHRKSQSSPAVDADLSGRYSIKYQAVLTLTASKLTKMDFIDASGANVLLLGLGATRKDILPPNIYLRYLMNPELSVFPPGTRGFVYYNPPTSQVHYPPLGLIDHGHLRFRLVEGTDPRKHFSKGRDLLMPDGTPWRPAPGLAPPGHNIKPFGMSAVTLRDRVLWDGLVTQDELDTWCSGPSVLRELGQRFLFNFKAQPGFLVKTEGAKGKRCSRWGPLFHMDQTLNYRPRRIWKSGGFYTCSPTDLHVDACVVSSPGIAICHLEPIGFHDDVITDLGMRVDEIIEPFVPLPGPPLPFEIPTTGSMYPPFTPYSTLRYAVLHLGYDTRVSRVFFKLANPNVVREQTTARTLPVIEYGEGVESSHETPSSGYVQLPPNRASRADNYGPVSGDCGCPDNPLLDRKLWQTTPPKFTEEIMKLAMHYK
ncbi:hypothetical protein K488DRAFT_90067 [Vararia minispora EC-137]|uniref:Uncharacterized protein n=1 Tax=Vararia minispora EC-137 TaxID=1314806 RepID=A0ACB8Q8J3_9AGAM|nr:hypothetical protein K488DRAFT_90067 [Vararia minispora EC-137]